MSASLPRHPSPDHLRKQAKTLLGAQRRRAPACCSLFRRLRRFSDLSDEGILDATVTLAEAQLALAMHYGYPSWKGIIEEARSYPRSTEYSLEAVAEDSEEPIPDYAGAGVPLAVVAAMNHAGIPIRYMEFAAASGWAFSFGYHYRDITPAFMGVRGRPGADGPIEVFASLPGEYGLGYEMARTGDPGELWSFVVRKVDAGIPVMSEHMDGGLIPAYRRKDGRRQLFFDGTVVPGWIDVDGMNPYAVYSFVKEGEAKSRKEIIRASLHRAVRKGKELEWEGVPQGMAALRAYLADVSDPEKDFAEVQEWFCWAAFERLLARRCAEVWLGSVATAFQGALREPLLRAARHYGEAFRGYDRYMGEVQACDPPGRTLEERARSPERIRIIAPILEGAIAEEWRGLEALEEVVENL